MKKVLSKSVLIALSLTLVLGNFLFSLPALAALDLVKSVDFDTVYYIDGNNIRHPFPDLITYQSWYGHDFSRVVSVSNDFLKNYPMGKNITIRPGTYLVKIRTAPQVYVVEQGGVLHELQNESIAEAIYGEGWAKRVVDVPDVFFDNYILGNPIIHDYKVPDDILFKNNETGKYYYKNNNILREFASTEAVLANRFKLEDAVVNSRTFFVRERPITGLDKNVFNPVAEPLTDRSDCENRKLRAAVIFLVDGSYTTEQIDKLQKIKKEIPAQFAWATDNLAEINFDYPTSIFFDDGYFLLKRNDGTTEVKNEVINSFYDNNQDIFDFIFVWTNFKIPSENTNEIAHFTPVTNLQEGTNRPWYDRGEVYGSTGKLKGLIVMGNINKYDTSTSRGLNEALNIVLHEILHQWSAYIEFIDESGARSQALLRADDYNHWSNYAGFISPEGGSGWIDNGNGTFTSELSRVNDTNLRQYSKLDLYLMGLIPAQLMDSVFYIEPTEPSAIGNTISGTAKWVTIDQIVKASGKIQCGF